MQQKLDCVIIFYFLFLPSSMIFGQNHLSSEAAFSSHAAQHRTPSRTVPRRGVNDVALCHALNSIAPLRCYALRHALVSFFLNRFCAAILFCALVSYRTLTEPQR